MAKLRMDVGSKVLTLEHPDNAGMLDFLDIEGRNGFAVTATRRADGGVSLRVRQSGPRGSSVFHDTDIEIEPFDSGEEPDAEPEDWGLCPCCDERGTLNDDGLCEGCAELDDMDDRDPAGGDDGDDDAVEGE